MSVDFSRFLDQTDLGSDLLALTGSFDGRVVIRDQVGQVDRRAEASGTTADDHDVELHHIAFDHGFRSCAAW